MSLQTPAKFNFNLKNINHWPTEGRLVNVKGKYIVKPKHRKKKRNIDKGKERKLWKIETPDHITDIFPHIDDIIFN